MADKWCWENGDFMLLEDGTGYLVLEQQVIIPPIILTPPAAVAEGRTAGPTVHLGSIVISGKIASAIAETVDPTVAIIGESLVLTPDPADAVGEVNGPVLIISALIIDGIIASAVAETAGPTVLISSFISQPEPADACGETAIGAILISAGSEFTPESPITSVWTPEDPLS